MVREQIGLTSKNPGLSSTDFTYLKETALAITRPNTHFLLCASVFLSNVASRSCRKYFFGAYCVPGTSRLRKTAVNVISQEP